MDHWRTWLMTALRAIALTAALALIAPGGLMGREAPVLANGAGPHSFVHANNSAADENMRIRVAEQP